MNSIQIMYPMLALVAWTFLVLLMIPYQRVKAVRSQQINADDFKLGESDNVPAQVSIPNRNYMNLLELPVLFYVVCIVLYLFSGLSPVTLGLAWVYVVLRIMHSLVHLTYNNVLHRLFFFATSNVVLSVIWIFFFLVVQEAGDLGLDSLPR
ncbi:MAG: MAPEG family protein [Pseudomonadales bacterium]|nr:MAPEG family protein [Pseudomonadales bacterium]